MNPIRVVVAEDSTTVRRYLCEVLRRDPGIVVAGEAADGRDAIELVRRLRPDVLTLDLMLPGVDGAAVTAAVMAAHPTPILVVSSAASVGEGFLTFDALRSGAVEVQDKPLVHGDAAWEERFLANVRLVARIRVITHVRGALGRRTSESAPPIAVDAAAATANAGDATGPRLVAIGASTGGPRAISAILCALPRAFPLPVLVVLHLSEGFDRGWRDWLASQCALRVELARDGDALPPVGEPRIVLAPAGRHLVVVDGRVRLSDAPERNSCRPSVDELFDSLVPIAPRTIACLLTGMGRDGAVGLRRLHDHGAATIAQDEGTSVVFGMPQEAIRLAAVDDVLPLDAIATRLSVLAAAEAF